MRVREQLFNCCKFIYLSIYLFIHVSKLEIIAQHSSSLSYSHDIQLILVHINEDSQLDKEGK